LSSHAKKKETAIDFVDHVKGEGKGGRLQKKKEKFGNIYTIKLAQMR